MGAKSTRRRRVRLSTASCPSCHEVGSLKEILWGMPDFEQDLSRYVIGGCCITGDDPDIACVKCEWRGLRKNLIPE